MAAIVLLPIMANEEDREEGQLLEEHLGAIEGKSFAVKILAYCPHGAGSEFWSGFDFTPTPRLNPRPSSSSDSSRKDDETSGDKARFSSLDTVDDDSPEAPTPPEPKKPRFAAILVLQTLKLKE